MPTALPLPVIAVPSHLLPEPSLMPLLLARWRTEGRTVTLTPDGGAVVQALSPDESVGTVLGRLIEDRTEYAAPMRLDDQPLRYRV